ncbi:MAG: hypothetical protein JNL74_02655 [Fibrobacteres bacterium]|nr:hypothetical protein [Fibrobacterota bacterium]
MPKRADSSLICIACNGSFPLRMADASHAIIMKCPLCGTNLLYYSGLLFQLSREELDRVLKGKGLSGADGIFGVGSGVEKRKHHKIVRFEPLHVSKREMMLSKEGQFPERKMAIDKEEVINLVIDLNTTVSVEDFLTRI